MRCAIIEEVPREFNSPRQEKLLLVMFLYDTKYESSGDPDDLGACRPIGNYYLK